MSEQRRGRPEVLIQQGERFNRWTFLRETEPGHARSGSRIRRGLFACECGVEKVRSIAGIRYGKSKSCGCSFQVAPSHLSQGPEYRSWSKARHRCSNPKSRKFKDYGGRGIRVCDEWSGPGGFMAFYGYMGIRPDGMTLDRWPDVNGDYEPGNVRWATVEQQNQNARTSLRWHTPSGAFPSVRAASKALGMSVNMIRRRVDSDRWPGWSKESALDEDGDAMKQYRLIQQFGAKARQLRESGEHDRAAIAQGIVDEATEQARPSMVTGVRWSAAV